MNNVHTGIPVENGLHKLFLDKIYIENYRRKMAQIDINRSVDIKSYAEPTMKVRFDRGNKSFLINSLRDLQKAPLCAGESKVYASVSSLYRAICSPFGYIKKIAFSHNQPRYQNF